MSTTPPGVEPARLATVLERKSVLERYCAIDHPTKDQAAAHADELGISAHRLNIMAKAWRALPEISQLSGATVKRKRPPKIGPKVVAIIESVIGELGPTASSTRILKRVRIECDDAGLPCPVLGTIHNWVMEARTDAEPSDQSRRFAAFQCRVHIPVMVKEAVTAPYITGIIELPAKTIRNALIAFGTPAPYEHTIAALLADLYNDEPDEKAEDKGPGRSYPRILVPSKKHATLSRMCDVQLEKAGRTAIGSALLGRHLGTLAILHRTYPGADEKLARKTIGRLNSALSMHDATALVRQAIDEHNRQRSGVTQ